MTENRPQPSARRRGPGRDAVALAGLSAQARALIDELPYLHCGDYNGFGPLHLLADDTLGFAFELAVPVVDTVPDGEEHAAEAITSMLHALRPGIEWQWFLRGDPGVHRQLALYRAQPGEDSASRLFADAFVARWHHAQEHGFFPGEADINFFPRSQRLVVALKSEALGLARPGMRELLADLLPARVAVAFAPLLARLHAESASFQRAARFVDGVREVLAAAHAHGWTTTPVDAEGLIDWLIAILFPQRPGIDAGRADDGIETGSPAAQVNEARMAMAAVGRIEAIDAAGFTTIAARQEAHHRVVSMLWQPRSVSSGMLNSLITLRPRLGICLSASPLPPTAALFQLKARALLNARSTHRFNATEMQARADALQEVEQRMFADGERIFDMRLQVHICEPSAQGAQTAADAVCKHLESLEIEAAVEVDIGSSLLLRGCLPFAIYPRTEHKLRRRRRLLSRDCADLHCGGGCWTGTPPRPHGPDTGRPAPIVLYSNPLGEPLFIDPTKAEKNPHALVIGQSGSGKSFFVHDYLLHLWRLPGVRLFLISIKADYRKLALLLGRYVEVSLDSEISLNPFAGRPSLENQARWFAALVLMLTEGTDSANLPRDAEVALQEAALAAAQKNWDAARQRPIRETLLEHICVELERFSGPLGRQLAAQLQPYRKGPYRKLFNQARSISADDRFIFFNLGNILRQPCAALASFCVFGLIDEVMTNPALRGTPKGLIADEVWALVRNPHAAAILERSLKAYRSLGGFAVPIVQDPQDLDTPSGRVMLVNTATKVILPLDRSGQGELQRYVRLNDRELEIVRNLRLYKRRYSEFFISIDGMRSAKGLLIPDPLRYAIATTDPLDEERIEAFFQTCGDMLGAVQRFACEFPYGLARRSPASAPAGDRD